MEEAYKRPRYNDLERSPNYDVWHKDLLGIFDQYEVPEKLLKVSKEELVKTSIFLLGRYDVSLEFTKDPQKSIFILAIADSWLRTSSVKERKALLEIMKLFLIEGKEIHSEYIRFLCGSQSKKVEAINPEAKAGHPVNKFIEQVYRFVIDNIDKVATAKNIDFVFEKSWEDLGYSALNQAREKLGITKDTEKPFSIAILSKTKKEISDLVGSTAFVLEINGMKTLVIGSDEDDESIFAHEYAHTQSAGWFVGLHTLLFRGLNEATTDLMMPIFDRTYNKQGDVLDKINSITGFEFREPLLKAYKEGGSSLHGLYKFIISRYGLESFLKLARMEVDSPNKNSKKIADVIYIKPKEVGEHFYGLYKKGIGNRKVDLWATN